MDHQTVAAYLRRIGLSDQVGEPRPELLAELHRQHLHTVPFENLSIHLGEPITLDGDALADKIIRRRRGGFCYELNGLFAELLTALGFSVLRHSAKVFGGDGELTLPFDHLTLTVELDERWLADVGFGRHSTYPLRMDATEPQADPDGTFVMVAAPYGDVDVLRDGEPQYRMEQRPRSLTDFRMGAWWNSTSPASHFTRSPVCSLATAEGRVSLSGNRLIRTVGDRRTETELAGDEAVLDAYRTTFGFELDRVPATGPSAH